MSIESELYNLKMKILRSKHISDQLKEELANDVHEIESSIQAKNNGVLDSVMLRCIAFEDYCRRKYISNINGKYFRNEFQIDYGEGEKAEGVYMEFLKQHEA